MPATAAEVAVVGRLHPALPDLVAGLVSRRRQALQLAGGDLADVAQQLRRERVVRVMTHVGSSERHAWELGGVLREVRDHRLARRIADDHRGERVAAPRLDAARDLVQRDPREPRKPLELRVAVRVDLRQVRRPQLHRGRCGIDHERTSVAVDDRAARGLHAHREVRVRARLVDVLRPGEHLQRPEPQEERGEDDEHQHAQDADPQREALRDAPGLDGGRAAGQNRLRRRPLCRRASQAAAPLSRDRSGRAAAGAGARARRRAP